MSTSTVKLYANARISPRNNFIVDSLSNYLSTLSDTITISDFQYIKHGLNIEIKVSLDQAYLDYHDLTNRLKYNYCSIVNSDQKKTVYYFIMDMEWRGMSTIKLTLSMDTINTFRENDDFYFNDKTKINRQHKDRFTTPVSTYSISAIQVTDDDEIKDLLITDSEILAFDSDNAAGAFGFTNADDPQTASLKISIYQVSTGQVVQTISGEICYINYQNGYWEFSDYNDDVIESIAYSSLYSTYGTCYIFVEYVGDGNYTAAYTAGTFYNNLVGRVSHTVTANRLIDLTSEGISPILYGTNKGALVDDGRNWYLVYRNDAGGTLRCYVCSDEKMDISIPASNNIVRTDLLAGYYYYIVPDDNSAYITATTAEGQSILIYREIFESDNDPIRYKVALEYWNDGSTISYRTHKYADIGLGFFYVSSSDTQTTSSLDVSIADATITYHYLASSTHDIANILAGTSGTYTLTPSTETNYSLSEVDRTDNTLIKIIQLPYKPVNDFLGFKFDSTNHMAYLDDLSVTFGYDFTELVYNPLEELEIDLSHIAITDVRSETYESKLYHSDYYQPKFIYDSFSFVFSLERQNLTGFTYNANFNITFTPSNTINSKFMFTFTDYNVDELALEDYSNILCVARNNEITVLNSAYIDYLRLGYNYEVKSKERQETGQWVGFGLSLVGSVASFAAGASGNALAIAGGITLATSAMAQLVSAVNTTAQAEANQINKMQQLRNQRTSVYGADDVDLMTKYTNNKAKFMLYQCSDKMKSVLYDLFFYTGYISGVMGIPDTTSRTRFNFVSCEPVFQQSTLTNIPEDILSDIELKMNAGVTYIHYYNSEWDFDQRYENWETSLF